MAMEGGREREGKQVSEDAAKEEEKNPELENGGGGGGGEEEGETESSLTETKGREIEEQSSPRGILEAQVSSSDSEHSGSLGSTDRRSSFGDEKPPVVERGGDAAEGVLSYGNLHWKKLFGQVKRTSSVWRSSSISLLGGYGLSKKTRKSGRNSSRSEDAIDCGDFVVPKPSWRNFSYEELRQATDDFNSDKLIGKGGHAEVYKGCLSDGQVVAVKKIIKEKKNDEDKVRDFLAELGIIAHIDHPNAAKLIGFGADRGLYLVLQFSPHGSLTTVLHGSEARMEWKIRYKVAIGVAQGLQYLHCDCQRRIIHRDITASNILLSEDNEAQISDFGLAKWLPENWVHLVVSPIEGTFGYMAPEYFMHGIVHEKSDVFAFGVMLLELVTGRRAVDSSRQSLVMWAKPLLEQNNVEDLADPRLEDVYDKVEMKRAMHTASTCIRHLPSMRPNMKRVVQLLKGESEGKETKQRCMGEKALMLDACDLEDYTSTAYLKDLNRHIELVME